MASRASAPTKPAPLLYTAQDVARFCEVDLKTVHHWADRGKVAHYRTEGRHLRFRRNDVVRFLRAHGYPLPGELADARPQVAFALGAPADGALSPDDLAKKLAARFAVQRFASAVAAIARVALDQPDALVVAGDDPTLGPAGLDAVREAAPWIVVATIGDARPAAAEIALGPGEAKKLAGELAKALAVG